MAKNRPIFKTSSHAGPLKLQPKTLYKKFSEINSTPPHSNVDRGSDVICF